MEREMRCLQMAYGSSRRERQAELEMAGLEMHESRENASLGDQEPKTIRDEKLEMLAQESSSTNLCRLVLDTYF